MTDTIEWLEIIGKSATLRRAPAEELMYRLTQIGVSAALKAAVMSGDRSSLFGELGHKPMKGEHNINGPGHEEEPEDSPGEHSPAHPPKPDQDKPVHDR